MPERNVLFVILESVRQRATCTVYDPACDRTEATNRLLPNRYSFTQMRSMDSCTAISLAVLWSGLYPTESRDTLHTWPLIFDYARATGYDTAFWTSQNMMFGNARLWVKNLGVSQFVSATDLEPTADLDIGAPEHLLAAHVNANIGKLKEPFLGVIQLSNVHYPYYVDPNGPQPFQPAEMSKGPDENDAFLNYYQNAVYQQDQHVARILEYVRSLPIGPRTVIVYTSDHGEAFREHGQMGHTFSIFDEEIHVPMWIDAPPGTLTPEEEANLRKKKDTLPLSRRRRAHDPRPDRRAEGARASALPREAPRAQLARGGHDGSAGAAQQLRRSLELRLRELGLHAEEPEARGALLGSGLEVLRSRDGSERGHEPRARGLLVADPLRQADLRSTAGRGDPEVGRFLGVRRPAIAWALVAEEAVHSKSEAVDAAEEERRERGGRESSDSHGARSLEARALGALASLL